MHQPEDLIVEMFDIQNKLNTKSYDKAWIEKGATEEFDYAMAAGDEAHEFARSLPFEWWKKNLKPDRSNQVTEIVDAWHFVMSQAIIDADGDVDQAAKNAIEHFRVACSTVLCSTVQRQMKLFVAMMYMHNGPYHLSTPEHYLKSFFNLTANAEVSIQLLYGRYVAKATLNQFRVAHGYKEGNYTKMWSLDGKREEDNYFLSHWVDDSIERTGDVPTADQAREFLGRMYERVQTENVPAT